MTEASRNSDEEVRGMKGDASCTAATATNAGDFAEVAGGSSCLAGVGFGVVGGGIAGSGGGIGGAALGVIGGGIAGMSGCSMSGGSASGPGMIGDIIAA